MGKTEPDKTNDKEEKGKTPRRKGERAERPTYSTDEYKDNDPSPAAGGSVIYRMEVPIWRK